MARVYEIRTCHSNEKYKVRGWKTVEQQPSDDDILRAQFCFGMDCDFILNGSYATYASKLQLAEYILDEFKLDACEVCDHSDAGVVVYKEWP